MSSAASTPASRLGAALAAIALWFVTALGLLCTPLGSYDEPLLLVGARLVAAGKLPYVDFYTHYGPLGYTLTSLFLHVGNAGTGYRVMQSVALALVALPSVVLAGRLADRLRGALLGLSLFLLNVSAALICAHALGYAFGVLALELAALAETETDPGRVRPLWLAAGVAVGLTGLVRPAFAAYVAAALIGLAAAMRFRAAARLGALITAAAATVAVVWLSLYRAIALGDAWFATLVVPARLIAGGGRFLTPRPLPPAYGTSVQTAFAMLLLASMFTLATLPSLRFGRRAARAAAGAGVALAFAAPLFLAVSTRGPQLGALLAALLWILAFVSLALAADTLRESAASRVCALAGLAGLAFLHYYLARADRDHLTAAAALVVSGSTVQLVRASRRLRIALAAPNAVVMVPLVLSYPALGIGREPEYPLTPMTTGFWARFPAAAFPTAVVEAVKRADRDADPNSRFVAAASDHSLTDRSSIDAFLLSARLPYTRWYQYDPGVQSNPLVQAEMVEELKRSGSATAVVWKSEAFHGEREADPPRTPLDRELHRMYPRRVAEFGAFEVREAP